MTAKEAGKSPVVEPANPIEAIRGHVSSHKKELFFLALIFMLGFGIRGHMMTYELFFEFDGYYHARMTEYVLTHGGSIPATDPLAYYQIPGGAPNPQFQDGPFWWLFTSTIFRIVTLGAPYSRDVFFVFVKFLPAVFGALTAVAMYYLGKEMYGRRAGAAMAFFAAVIPAFVYRTMAGWYEGQSVGFLWMVLGMIFFVRAIKTGELNRAAILNAAWAVFFFTLMAATWQAFLMVPYLLLGFIGLSAVLLGMRYIFANGPVQKSVNVIGISALVFALFFILTSVVIGQAWIGGFTGNITHVFDRGVALDLGNAGQTAGSVFSTSVGEESKGAPYWGNKYNALAVFIGWPVASGFPWYIPGAVFIFLLYRMLIRRDDNVSALAFTWIVFAIFLAYIKLKFTFYLGIPLALAAGITVNDAIMFVGERPGFEKKLVAFVLGFFLLIGLAAGSFFISQNVPNIEYDTGWKESLKWISANTPQDAKFFNWWDEGHWLTFIGQRAASTDNRNAELKSNSEYANFVLAKDENAAVAILETRYHPDYVLVSEDLVEKLGSLGIYAYGTTDAGDPRISQYFSVGLPCRKIANPLTKVVAVQCGGNQLPESEYNALPSRRIEEPNQVLQGKQRVFIYRNESGTKLFIINKAANDTFLVKMFFEKEKLAHFEQIYENKEVRIFKYTP